MENRNRYPGQLLFLNENSDVLMALCVVGILILMVIPLPTMLLDLLISLNITCSLVILLAAMYVLRPLDLSAFPSMLLIATLFRLALNISSTRLILLNGNQGTDAAGKVIQAFGNFVVGGNYVVGGIVFLILVIINFVVITKGAGRIAEVAARFTLDAMPGKQMSIDADLNAGLISEDEARTRRRTIARESEYYGAMDGASKFVRGDAIAGIVITLINIIGGLVVGVLQQNMTIGDAAQTYTLLTVGDGLVTQIPALVVSSSAGIVVTRAGAEASMGKEISSQLMSQPRAIAITAAILFGLGLVPGLPKTAFFVLSAITGGLAWVLFRAKQLEQAEEKERQKLLDKSSPVEKLEFIPPPDILALDVGYALIPLVDVEQDGELLDRIRTVRMQIGDDIGIIVPPIHIQDNMRVRPGEYTIYLKGNRIAGGELMPKHFLAMYAGTPVETIEGIRTKEPTYGLPALWIKESQKEQALGKGYTVVDPPTVLITHLSDVIRRYADELLGRQEVKNLLDNMKSSHPALVDELVPNLLPLGGVGKVLRNLLKEQVPIRDLPTIMEALADWAPMVKDIDTLTEYVRQELTRTITGLYQTSEGDIHAMTVDQNVEKTISQSVTQTDQGSFLAIEPETARKIVRNIAGKLETFTKLNRQPIVICSAHVRSHLRKLVERFIPDLVVLSYNEISSNIKIQPMGTVGLTDAD